MRRFVKHNEEVMFSVCTVRNRTRTENHVMSKTGNIYFIYSLIHTVKLTRIEKRKVIHMLYAV